MEGHFARTCTLGSCDDHIFSQECTNKIVNLQCPRYETIQNREADTIGKMKKKLDDRDKRIVNTYFTKT